MAKKDKQNDLRGMVRQLMRENDARRKAGLPTLTYGQYVCQQWQQQQKKGK